MGPKKVQFRISLESDHTRKTQGTIERSWASNPCCLTANSVFDNIIQYIYIYIYDDIMIYVSYNAYMGDII